MADAARSNARGALSGFLDRRTTRWEAIPGNLRGGVWMFLGAGFLATMVALIKAAGETLHVTEILFFRQLFMMILVLPVLVRDFPTVLATTRLDLHLMRIAAAAAAMLLSFTAVVNMPLADVTTIGFAKTFFITIFAILVLGETVGFRRWSAMAIGFLGVLLVAGPGGAESINVYGLMAIAGAAAAGLVMVLIRKLTRTDRPVTILSYQAIGIGLLMVPPTIWFWKTPDLNELLLLVAIGVVSLLGQMCNIFAFRAGEASAIAPLEYLRLFYATIIGWLIFNEWPHWEVFAGAAIIIAAALYTMHREHRVAKRAAAPAKAGTQ